MAHPWPESTAFLPMELEVDDRTCPECLRTMVICDHRVHRVFTLEGPVCMVCKLTRCPDAACPGYHRTASPEAEIGIALPHWLIAWDVFAWIGHRRFARHWSVPQIRAELLDSHRIQLSDDAIEDYVQRYQTMLAALHQSPDTLSHDYRGVRSLVLSIDGLQPEKGHETLYVVRELRLKRVWFAKPLLSSAAEEVHALFAQAKEWAERLGLPVVGWISDKQDAFVSGVKALFPGVPHRFCRNHFLRDVAEPVLKADAQVKVRMRRKVRGLRAIERAVLEAKRARERRPRKVPRHAARTTPDEGRREADPPVQQGEQVVLDYCAAVRGVLNDDQGGPLTPPGIRMADALTEVRESIQGCLDGKKRWTRRKPAGAVRAVH
jgi:hypothetical protein